MYKKRQFKPQNTNQHRINHQIKAQQIRLIGSDDKQIGILSIQDAMRQARQQGLDLIEIAAKAQPPVVKIADYKKFQYQQNKKEAVQAKKAKKGQQLKEIRFKPFMAQGDFLTRINRITEFLNDAHRIRVSIPFHGRQLAHKDAGFQLADRILQQLGETAKVDQDPKFVGKKLIMILSPAPKASKPTGSPD